jgi:hypothetical protein
VAFAADTAAAVGTPLAPGGTPAVHQQQGGSHPHTAAVEGTRAAAAAAAADTAAADTGAAGSRLAVGHSQAVRGGSHQEVGHMWGLVGHNLVAVVVAHRLHPAHHTCGSKIQAKAAGQGKVD